MIFHYTIQIGGSLAKVVYFIPNPEPNSGGRMMFEKFETDHFDRCLDFVQDLIDKKRETHDTDDDEPKIRQKGPLDLPKAPGKRRVVIKATGGGAHYYYNIMSNRFQNVEIKKEVGSALSVCLSSFRTINLCICVWRMKWIA